METAWSVLKPRVFRKFTEVMLSLKSDRERCKAIVQEELDKLDPELLLKLTTAHHTYIYKLLIKVATEY